MKACPFLFSGANMKWIFIASCIVLFGFSLRVSKLEQQAIWWDEAWSITLSERSFPEITPIIARDAHPPLYQWVLHLWIRLTGITEFAARYFSVLVGTLTLAVVLALAKRLLRSIEGAWLTGILVALSVVSINWSQEARMYALGALWGTLVVYAYLRVGERLNRWWLLLLFASICAPMSQYLSGFAVVVVNLDVLFTLRQRDRNFLGKWFAVIGTTGIIVGGWIVYALRLATRNPRTTDHDLIYPLQLWAVTLVNGGSNFIEQFILPAFVLVILIFVGFVVLLLKRQPKSLLLIMLVTLPPFFVWAINFVLVLPLSDRYYALYAPLAIIGVVAALMALWHRWLTRVPLIIAGIGLLMFGSMATYRDWDARYFRDDYASMIRAVDILANEGERVNFISGERYPLVEYYLRRLYYPAPIPDIVRGVPSGDDWRDLMPTVTGNAESLWLIFIERILGDRDGARETWLRENYQVITETSVDYNGFGLYGLPESAIDYPNPQIVLPPVITEVRPMDWIRVGVPAAIPATLRYGEIEVATVTSERWDLAQFRMYPAYPNGEYQLLVDNQLFTVTMTHSQTAIATMTTPIVADFGDMQLVSLDLPSREMSGGQTLPVTLVWHTPQRSNRDVRVFVHLVGEEWNNASNSFLWAQSDGLPVETPLNVWWEGLIAHETRILQLPDNLPSGMYRLYVGLYDAVTNERLTDVQTGSDYVAFATLQAK